MRSRFFFVAAALLAAAAASADTLSDVKRSLSACPGRAPMHAQIDFTRVRHSHGRLLNDDFEASASVDVAVDATTTRVAFRRPLLDRAAVNRPTAMTLAELTGPGVESALDFAPDLQRMISRGRVVEDRSAVYEGRSVRLLRLVLPATAEGDDPTSAKMSEDSVTLWIGEGSVPTAVRRVRKGSVGMLLVHVDTVRTETWRLEKFADHLVVSRLEDRSVVTGAVQHGEAASVWSVSHPGEP